MTIDQKNELMLQIDHPAINLMLEYIKEKAQVSVERLIREENESVRGRIKAYRELLDIKNNLKNELTVLNQSG